MSDLAKHFPNLHNGNHVVMSPETVSYNCIAWAAGDTERWWSPDRFGLYYWPHGVPREETLHAFQEVYHQLGYTDCENANFEEGFEKIALFANDYGIPTHAALQLANGRWTSKCGELEDIEHDLMAISSGSYGTPVCYLKRVRRSTSSSKPSSGLLYP